MPTPADFADALVLTGPTGSGKSAVALDLAEQLGCEIVPMDSMTLYRGMDIGTAKPTAAEQARVPHHLIDVLDPWESGSVAWWLERSDEACRQIRSRGKRPLFVGGTPFFLKALLYGLFDAPPVDPAVRARLEAEVALVGKEVLHRRLMEVDPKTSNRLHSNDIRRVIRALEVYETTGRPISSFQLTWHTPTFAGGNQPPEKAKQIPCVVLDWPRPELYRRIDLRVDGMLAAGWLEEVRRLSTSHRPLSQEAGQAIGYRLLQNYLWDGGGGWDETVTTIKMKTRQYAKKQLTWFRHLAECVSVSAPDSQLSLRVIRAWGG
jgi:tRNA dimethylallyltransferase